MSRASKNLFPDENSPIKDCDRSRQYIVSNGGVVRPRRILPSPKKKRAPLPPSFLGNELEEITLRLDSGEESIDSHDRLNSNPNRLASVFNDRLHMQRSLSAPAIVKNETEAPLSPRQRAYAFSMSSTPLVESDWLLVKPVKLWTREEICSWLHNTGLTDLSKYIPDLSGQHLANFAEHGLGSIDIKDNELQERFIEELNKLGTHRDPTHQWNITEQPINVTAGLSDTPNAADYLDTLNLHRSDLSIPQLHRDCDLNSNLEDSSQQNQLSMSGKSTAEYLKLQVRQWSNDKVVEWLEIAGLEKYKPVFKEKNITGEHLMNIDMKLLDEMQITTTQEREELLSSIYLLINTNSALNSSLERSNSGNSLVKTIPLKRSGSANSSPDKMMSSQFMSPRTPPVIGKTGLVKQGSDKKKKGGLSKLKEKMGPKIFGMRAKDTSDCVHVWNSLKAHADSMLMTPLKCQETTTCTEVIHRLLEQHEITDDYNLFCLVECPINPEDEILDREMGKLECPLFVEHHWSNPSAYRLELHKRRGKQIKVVYQITGMRQRGKSFSISYSSICTDVLKTALRKIRLRNVDESLFCLMEVDKEKGNIRPVDDTDVVLNLSSDCFVLCDRVNMDTLCEDENVQNAASVVRRSSSLMSHGSSFSGNSIGSATSIASSESDSIKPRTEKLESLEAQMATIEVSINGSQTPESPRDSWPQPREPVHTPQSPQDSLSQPQLACETDVECKTHQELTNSNSSESDDKDKIIETLQDDFQQLILKTKQLEGYQRQLTQAEHLLEERQIVWQCKLDSLKNQLSLSYHKSSWDVLRLEMDVENARCEVEAKSKLIAKLQEDLKVDGASTRCVEDDRLGKEYKLAVHESSLLRMKQKLLALQDELDIAIQRQQKSPVNLSCMVGSHNQQVLSLLVLSSGVGISLQAGTHMESIIDNVPSDSLVKRGDRILEIDDKNALVLTQNELGAMLRIDKPVKLLVLRDDKPILDKTDDEIDILKDELSVALMELESAHQDNNELIQDNNKLLEANEKYEKDNKLLKDQVVSLNRKVKVWEERWTELRSSLVDMKTMDIDPARIIEVPKPNNGSHKTRIKDHELSQMKNMLAQNGSHIARLQESLRAKELALEVICKEKEALTKMQEEKLELSYEDLETDVPLWVSLKKASKESVLQALKDNILQNAKQKAYLDRLLAVVIEQAPTLLEGIETEELEQVIEGSTQDAAWC